MHFTFLYQLSVDTILTKCNWVQLITSTWFGHQSRDLHSLKKSSASINMSTLAILSTEIWISRVTVIQVLAGFRSVWSTMAMLKIYWFEDKYDNMTWEYKIPVKAELLPDTAVEVDSGLVTRFTTAGPCLATMRAQGESCNCAELASLVDPHEVLG